jgi:uncharacterized repeat protein (TIGR04138 family)
MADERSDEQKINDILLREPRYRREAYRFIQESLEFSRRKLKRDGHVTGRELALGLRDLAKERFGLMARTVLNQWGIFRTRDIGELVFIMVEEQIMIKQNSDSRDDFDDVYDFNETFDKDFQIEMEE